MPFTVLKTDLNEAMMIVPSVFTDHRGTFIETYNTEEFFKIGININFKRDDISTSAKNVLRGLHYDNKTWKLIQCMHGEFFFVICDMRKDSPQYLKWQSFLLSDKNRYQILVPPGFANGHLVLSDSCIFHYKMSEYYEPENEIGVRWDDPKLGIPWPVKEPILSEKDSSINYL
ncbi:MAG: dTDP-4-dehydrorhamnose 3,5-epimerase [Bacteroidota bacterium]|nr:dTDP-4-dehydrorhamnose 3,5-epimerase [Bacteroidota bacterium]